MPVKRSSSNILDWFQNPIGWWVLFGIWAVFFFIVTGLPGEDLPREPFRHFDKVVHFSAFLTGAAILFPAIYLMGKWQILASGLIALVLSVGLGVFDEILQIFVPGRKGGDLGDILANSLGALTGVLMLMAIYGYTFVGRRAKARVRASR